METIKKREAVILEQKGGLLREKQKFQKDLDERAQKIEFMIKKVFSFSQILLLHSSLPFLCFVILFLFFSDE